MKSYCYYYYLTLPSCCRNHDCRQSLYKMSKFLTARAGLFENRLTLTKKSKETGVLPSLLYSLCLYSSDYSNVKQKEKR